ncbi:MAG: bacteriohemerythrin [Candidatus Colwellbacteria bacterium]|nr:bacteriohemerythrin [Candidatus Colwellbacteria bacterium]
MEEKFVWTEEYSVQNAVIDGQHKTFFDIANDLSGLAAQENVKREDIFSGATKLRSYALFHLGTEEEMFSKYGYNGTEHIAAHNAFRNKVEEMMNAVRSESADAKKEALNMAEFSASWLRNHIMVMDKQYAPFFTEKGLE